MKNIEQERTIALIHTNDQNSPNIQTSLAEVNLLKLIDSGAIHLIGSFPLEAETEHRHIKMTYIAVITK